MSCRSFDISALLSFVRFLNSLISCSLLEIFLGFFCTSAYSFSYSFLANIFDYCLFTNEALYRMRTHNSHTLVQHNSRDLYSLLMVNALVYKNTIDRPLSQNSDKKFYQFHQSLRISLFRSLCSRREL